MTLLFTRWLVVALVAIGLGVAGLYRSVCIADERVVHPTVREGRLPSAPEPELPIGAEVDQSEVSASPRLTY
jgi:hypothetical protein